MAKVERKSHTEGKHTAPPIATGAKGDKRGFDRAKVCYSGAAAGEVPAVHPSLVGGRDVVNAICLDRRQHDDQKTRPKEE
jgi:hypothetical protein